MRYIVTNKVFTLYTYIKNNGDGSASVKYFRSKESRDKLQETEEDKGEAFCEADGELKFMILDDGTIVDARHQDSFYLKNPNYLSIKD